MCNLTYLAGPGTSSEEQLSADREVGAAVLLLCPRHPSTGQTRHQVCGLHPGKEMIFN